MVFWQEECSEQSLQLEVRDFPTPSASAWQHGLCPWKVGVLLVDLMLCELVILDNKPLFHVAYGD